VRRSREDLFGGAFLVSFVAYWASGRHRVQHGAGRRYSWISPPGRALCQRMTFSEEMKVWPLTKALIA
jgi:hypothetical protein